ncbi:MAG: translocation/assembly module TamB, partial [Nitrospirota bacterium]|nr:translocation/assembly module TamB [Nitrospirota bacterium]
ALKMTGRWKEPEFLGEINLNNVTAKLTGFQYKIGPVNGSFYLNRNRLTFEDISAGFANGTATMSGTGYLKGLSLERIYISSTLDSMRIRPMERVSAAFDGRLFYERSSKGSILSGNIDIEKAKYGKKVEFNKLMLGLNEIQKGGQDITDLLGRTELNIHITGMEDILIDNNIAKTPVKISLNVMGSVDQKGLIGRVEADEGTIFFRGNEFKILEGSSVEFVSPNSISPVFHVLSETYVNDYYIRLTLDGTTDNFALSLYSDPPLSEMDILTLLTFGQVKREMRGFESGLAASEATSVLTGGLQEAVEDRFKNIADVERFEIEPHTTATGSLSPKVTVGKRVLEDKLYVIYSTSIGTTEEHIIKLRYSINKNIAIVGSRDEIGSAGMDLKYRFEFR